MVCYFCASFQKHMLKKSMEYHQTNSPRQQQNQAWQASQQTTQQNAPYYPPGAAGSTTVEPTHVPGLDLNSSFNNNTLNSSGGQQQNINQLIGNPDDVQSRYKYNVYAYYYQLFCRWVFEVVLTSFDDVTNLSHYVA